MGITTRFRVVKFAPLFSDVDNIGFKYLPMGTVSSNTCNKTGHKLARFHISHRTFRRHIVLSTLLIRRFDVGRMEANL